MQSTYLVTSPGKPDSRWLPKLIYLALFALVYWLATRLWSGIILQPDNLAVIWPASGIALAALLLSKRQVWAAILGIIFGITFITSLISGSSPVISAGYAIIYTLEPALVAWVIERWRGRPVTLTRLADVLALAFAAVLTNSMTTLAGALLSTASHQAFFTVYWLLRWIASGLGVLMITPLILTWAYYKPDSNKSVRARSSVWSWVEKVAWTVMLVISTSIMFGTRTISVPLDPRPYLVFPVMIWAALRFSLRAVTAGTALLGIIAITATIIEVGAPPYLDMAGAIHLAQVQALLWVISLTVMVLSTTLAERKHTGQALAESEAHLRGVLANSPDTIFTIDLSNRQPVFVNRETFCGYTRQELSQPGALFFAVHPNDAAAVNEILQQVSSKNQVSPVEYRLENKTGDFEWIEQRTAVLSCNADGSPKEALLILSIITERKRANDILQARIRISEYAAGHTLDELLQYALDEFCAFVESPIGFFHFVEADQHTIALLAWSTATLNAMCTAEGAGHAYDVSQAGVWADSLRQAAPVIHNNFASLPGRRGFPDGHAPVSREIVLPILRDQKVVALIGAGNNTRNYTASDVSYGMRLADLIWDIVEHKKAENQLEQSARDLNQAQHYSHVGSWKWQIPENRIECSDEMLRICGINREHFNGDRAEIIVTTVHPEDRARVEQFYLAQIYQSRLDPLEYRVIWPDGSVHYIWSKAGELIRDEQNRPLLLKGFAQDITERKLAENALRASQAELQDAQARLLQSEKLASIGRLVAGVAHELNNPLTSVIIVSQLLQRRFPENQIQHDLQRIILQAERAARIVRGLLDFARQRRIELQPVQLNQLLTDSLELIAFELRAHSVEYGLRLEPDLPLTSADPHQIQQVFLNLIQNAWQAIAAVRPSGRLTITSRAGPSSYQSEDIAQPVISFIFEDDGPGIPEANLTRIFDPFFSTKPVGQGTGLGLSICHGIIAEHGGHLWAENRPGSGARFICELPIIRQEVGQPRLSGEHEEGNQPEAQHTILIIDDEDLILENTALFLRSCGYRVDTEIECAAAFKRLETLHYDLILCDIRMPGMSGVDFYHQVKAIETGGNGGPTRPLSQQILFITGDAISPATYQFLEETRTRYINKPFNLEHLEKIVRESLKTRGNL